MDHVKERADYHARILPHDHRSRAEKERAHQIWKHLRPRGNTKGFFLIANARCLIDLLAHC